MKIITLGKLLILALIIGGTSITKTNIDLDNKKLIQKTLPVYWTDQSKGQVTITLHNVGVECRQGVRPKGKRLGNFPNPDFEPFGNADQKHQQSPHCILYYKKTL